MTGATPTALELDDTASVELDGAVHASDHRPRLARCAVPQLAATAATRNGSDLRPCSGRATCRPDGNVHDVRVAVHAFHISVVKSPLVFLTFICRHGVSMTVMSAETIDLQAAAGQLGVHYQTAYKWVRSGELPAAMVMGSYSLDRGAVARFAERRARPVPPRTRRPRTGFAVLSRRVHDHLVAGEERQAARLISGLVGGGVSMTAVAQDVLVPALRDIGEEWQAGRLDISIEHRASAIVDRILGQRYPSLRGRRRGAAVVAALSGDQHVLPTTLAAISLRDDNWLVHHLGADLPPEELVRFCQEEHVDLAVLTVTVSKLHRSATRAAAQLEGLGLRALVGGPGRTLDELQRLARHQQRHATADSDR